MSNGIASGEWTEEEDLFLKANFFILGQSEIARTLKRTRKNVRIRATELGFENRGKARPWTEEDIKFVADNYGKLTQSEICDRLGRTKGGLNRIAEKLSVAKEVKAWTQEEDEFLRENYSKLTQTEIALQLGRTERGVDGRANRLKLTQKANLWTAEEEAFLTENYKKLSPDELVLIMNRSWSSISSKAHLMRLTHPHPSSGLAWEEWEINVLKCFCQSLSAEEIAELLPRRSSRAIRDRLVQMKLIDFTPLYEWTEPEREFIRNNYLTYTFDEIAIALQELFGRKRRVTAIGVVGRSFGLRKIEWYTANRNFFKQPNMINSYWSGFIAADGCIDDFDPACKSLKIDLQIADEGHLQRFIDDTKYNGNIKYPSRGGSALVRVSCAQQWFVDLESNFSITPRKSKKPLEKTKSDETMLQPPDLSETSCKLAYIKGLIDGDGSIYISHSKSRMWLVIKIVGSLSVLTWLKQTLDDVLDLGSVASVKPTSTVYGYSLGTKKAETLCKVLLPLNTPALYRKWVIAAAWLVKDTEVINAYMSNKSERGKSHHAVLNILKIRKIEPQDYLAEIISLLKL